MANSKIYGKIPQPDDDDEFENGFNEEGVVPVKSNTVTGKIPKPQDQHTEESTGDFPVTSNKVTGSIPKATIKTKKSDIFPVYAKDSKEAGDFRSAFAAARKAGLSTFEWNGRKYSTARKK